MLEPHLTPQDADAGSRVGGHFGLSLFLLSYKLPCAGICGSSPSFLGGPASSPKQWGWYGGSPRTGREPLPRAPLGASRCEVEHSGGEDRVGVAAHPLQHRGLGEIGRGLCTRSRPVVTRGEDAVTALGTESPTLAAPGRPWGVVYPGPAHWREAPPIQPMPNLREPQLLKILEA